jgi:hypothetical protein
MNTNKKSINVTKQNNYYENMYVTNKMRYKFINSLHGGKLKQHKYYVLHSTSYENMLSILNSKTVYSNKYTDNTRLSGDVLSEYVFCNLITNGDNIDNFGIGLIFNEKILEKKSFIFNNAWLAKPFNLKLPTIDLKLPTVYNSIYVYSSEKKNSRTKKMQAIYDIIKQNNSILEHEIMFPKKINLKFLVGIHCPGCDDAKKNIIVNALEKNKIQNVYVYSSAKLPVI